MSYLEGVSLQTNAGNLMLRNLPGSCSSCPCLSFLVFFDSRAGPTPFFGLLPESMLCMRGVVDGAALAVAFSCIAHAVDSVRIFTWWVEVFFWLRTMDDCREGF